MARVYWYGVSDASYTGDSTQWDLYLYDIQTFTSLTVGTAHNGTNVPDGSLVRGLSSGATGFVSGRNSTRLDLSQTSGEFLEGEQIIINDDVALKDGIKDIVVHNTEDIKSVFQDVAATISGVSGQGTFLADTVLYQEHFQTLVQQILFKSQELQVKLRVDSSIRRLDSKQEQSLDIKILMQSPNLT